MYNDKSTKSVADAVAKILEASTPKTEKEKDLAALGHPKDKITHKDVLIGRGVLKKEEVEQIDELSTDKLTAYTKAAKTSRAELNKKWTQGKASWRDKEKVINREKGEDRANKILDRRAVIDKEMKEETEYLPFAAMLESYAQGGIKAFFENFVVQEEFEQVEEEATSDEFVSELEKAKRKAAGKEKNEVSKASVQAVQNEEVEEIDEAIQGMTVKQHAEKTRQLKAEVEKHLKAKYDAIERHGEAEAALEAHRQLDPKYAAKKKAKDAAGWDDYRETGRSMQRRNGNW